MVYVYVAERDENIRRENERLLANVQPKNSSPRSKTKSEEGRFCFPGTRLDKNGRPKVDSCLSPRESSHTRGEAVPMVTLNYEQRKRDVERITQENLRLLESITNVRGKLDRKEMEKDHIRSRDYLSLSSERPVGEPGSVPRSKSPREPAFGKKHFNPSRTTLRAGSSVLSSPRSHNSGKKTDEATLANATSSELGSPGQQHSVSHDLGEDKSSVYNEPNSSKEGKYANGTNDTTNDVTDPQRQAPSQEEGDKVEQSGDSHAVKTVSYQQSRIEETSNNSTAQVSDTFDSNEPRTNGVATIEAQQQSSDSQDAGREEGMSTGPHQQPTHEQNNIKSTNQESNTSCTKVSAGATDANDPAPTMNRQQSSDSSSGSEQQGWEEGFSSGPYQRQRYNETNKSSSGQVPKLPLDST